MGQPNETTGTPAGQLGADARMERITDVAATITQLLGAALQHTGLPLRDVMLCAVLGLNGLGKTALVLQPEGGPLTEDSVRAMMDEAIEAGLKAKMMAMKFKNQAEMDEFFKGAETGLH